MKMTPKTKHIDLKYHHFRLGIKQQMTNAESVPVRKPLLHKDQGKKNENIKSITDLWLGYCHIWTRQRVQTFQWQYINVHSYAHLQSCAMIVPSCKLQLICWEQRIKVSFVSPISKSIWNILFMHILQEGGYH